ncbi:MAG: hypothetical protein KDB71_19020 [Mycobacterium sp.]|nr:hypothetical protein [Mycobacterium sp.]
MTTSAALPLLASGCRRVAAITDATIGVVGREETSAVVQRDNLPARRIGEEIEIRRRAAREALGEAG